MSCKQEQRRTLQEIQADKTRLFAIGEGEFALRLSEASLALGISQESLDRVLVGQGKGLVIRSNAEGMLVFGIEDLYSGKDLWDEVLKTLKNGRSELGNAKDLYETLFIICKSLVDGKGDRLGDLPIEDDTPGEITSIINFLKAKGNVSALDVELADLQQMATIAFLGLPKGTREELIGQVKSPEFIMVQSGG